MFSSHKLNYFNLDSLCCVHYQGKLLQYYIQERRIVKRLLYERSKLSNSIFIHIDEMLNGVCLYNSIILSSLYLNPFTFQAQTYGVHITFDMRGNIRTFTRIINVNL